MIAVEVDTQRVPLAGHDLHVGSLLLGAFTFDGVVDRHVVLEAIGARDVVVVSVLQPPDNAGLNSTWTNPFLIFVSVLKQTGKVA